MKVLNLDVKSGELISGESIQQVKMIMMDRLITCCLQILFLFLLFKIVYFIKKLLYQNLYLFILQNKSKFFKINGNIFSKISLVNFFCCNITRILI